MKKIILFLTVFFGVFSQSFGKQSDNEQLAKADSLFAQKHYTESFELYQELVFDKQLVSNSMLLKMAFIKEGMKDYGATMYFLNKYYDRTLDQGVLKKMDTLAKNAQLQGYEFGDRAYFSNLYQQYYDLFNVLIFLILSLLLAGFLYYNNKSVTAKWSFVAASWALILFWGLELNIKVDGHRAIVSFPKTAMLDAPSAGGDVVGMIGAGHRVEVVGHQDVWTKILWEGKAVYVKDHNLQLL
ncbi:SH3 domain-containing protein [Persicobacter psychrovividus]|uniref:SH3 domain-containing protein n=1 Tax=Persicobacter psychrovividus TaxID=387638 RepID=A0ABN6LEW4_9BACT|nr:hypothetical protein PEPS_22670 [Persicobacter psychrovividus]